MFTWSFIAFKRCLRFKGQTYPVRCFLSKRWASTIC